MPLRTNQAPQQLNKGTSLREKENEATNNRYQSRILSSTESLQANTFSKVDEH
jgi:hypothetical protein